VFFSISARWEVVKLIAGEVRRNISKVLALFAYLLLTVTRGKSPEGKKTTTTEA
jgi:hypothetical protein